MCVHAHTQSHMCMHSGGGRKPETMEKPHMDAGKKKNMLNSSQTETWAQDPRTGAGTDEATLLAVPPWCPEHKPIKKTFTSRYFWICEYTEDHIWGKAVFCRGGGFPFIMLVSVCPGLVRQIFDFRMSKILTCHLKNKKTRNKKKSIHTQWIVSLHLFNYISSNHTNTRGSHY